MTRRRLLDLVGLLVCLLLVALINATVRGSSPGVRWYTGTLASGAVHSPDLDVQVTGVEIARTVEGASTSLFSSGVLVVVHWTATVHRESARFSRVELHTHDGLELSQRGEFYTESMPVTPAGFTSTGSSVFELRPYSLASADFVVNGDRGLFYTYGYAIRVESVLPADPQILDFVTLPQAQSMVTP